VQGSAIGCIRYHWGQGPEGPRDFLDRGEAGSWGWLFDGFGHADELYITGCGARGVGRCRATVCRS
jgi:hypothetical protein